MPNDLASLYPTASKDARRFGQFSVAASKKVLELGTTDPQAALAFAVAVGQLAVDAGEIADKVRKNPLGMLFGDPYKQWRQSVRRFAVEWKLDPAFVASMG